MTTDRERADVTEATAPAATEDAPGADPALAGGFTEDYLLFLLAQASAAASAAFHAELARQGISVSTWRILASLYPDQRLKVGVLARKCLLKQPTLTRALDRLTVAGLVRRAHATDDRRGVLVSLTERGRDLATPLVARAHAHERAIMEPYSEAAAAELKQRLRQLIARLQPVSDRDCHKADPSRAGDGS